MSFHLFAPTESSYAPIKNTVENAAYSLNSTRRYCKPAPLLTKLTIVVLVLVMRLA